MSTPAGLAPALIFFGTENYSAQPLRALIASGARIVAVVTKPDAPSGRGRILTAPPVKLVAQEYDIPVFQPNRLTDIADKLASLQPAAGVLVAYGKIIPQGVLALFPRGIINIHPSLLPKYRGPSPIEAAMLHGDTTTGVSLMRLDVGMDTGPLYDQARLSLNGLENRQQLYTQLFDLGTELLLKHLSGILDGSLQARPQSARDISITRLIQKADGQLDPAKPAAQLVREIRAYLGWPGSRTPLMGTDVIITAAHIAESGETPSLSLATADGMLIIDRLKPTGKREMSAAEFLAGRR